MNRRLLLLALCQGFFLTNNVTFIAINGLVGLSAGAERLDGDAAGHRLRRRRRAVSPGWWRGTSAPGAAGARSSSACVVAMASTALCAWAALSQQLLAAGRRRPSLAGYYNANAGLYRFAATELVAPAFKERAISWVLAGGILGAVAGPNLAQLRRATRCRSPFAGAYAGARRRRAAVAGDALVHPLPAAAAAERRPRRAGRCARSRASRCSSSPSSPARSATA